MVEIAKKWKIKITENFLATIVILIIGVLGSSVAYAINSSSRLSSLESSRKSHAIELSGKTNQEAFEITVKNIDKNLEKLTRQNEEYLKIINKLISERK